MPGGVPAREGKRGAAKEGDVVALIDCPCRAGAVYVVRYAVPAWRCGRCGRPAMGVEEEVVLGPGGALPKRPAPGP